MDITFVTSGFEFDSVFRERRRFRIEEVETPVARLSHIVTSKMTAGRPKDKLFLATHEDLLRQLLVSGAAGGPPRD